MAEIYKQAEMNRQLTMNNMNWFRSRRRG